MMGGEEELEGRRGPEDCLSDYALDRLRLGELEGSEPGRAARVHLAGCARCTARLTEISAVVAPPRLRPVEAAVPSPAAKDNRRSAGHRPLRARRAFFAGGAVLAAAAAVVLFVGRGPDQTRIKGTVDLVLILARGGAAPTEIGTDERLRPGDRLRFRVGSRRAGYTAILEIDGTGQVSALVPRAGRAVALPGGPPVLLDGTVELDEAPGPVQMLAIVCPEAETIESLASAVQRAVASGGAANWPAALPAGCVQRALTFAKSTPP